MRMWLCNRKITTVGEVLTKPLTRTQVGIHTCISKAFFSPKSMDTFLSSQLDLW